MRYPILLIFAVVASAPAFGVEDSNGCRQVNVDFIVVEGEATLAALEDDIRIDLEKLGVNVTRRFLAKDDFNTAMTTGDFNMAFSETWGPPYDPHSYAKSWSVPDEAHFAAHQGLQPPMTKADLDKKIDEVLTISNEQERQDAWTEILTAVHELAINLPFSGKRIPAVIRKRLWGFTPGYQQFDYPLHTLRVESGSKTITVAPGGQTGLFVGVGRLDPHTYRPNEFFASNWVYEGLVEYGPNGSILPSLAASWTVAGNAEGGQVYTFTLRQNVTFHDGAAWNCTVAKLNFDHVLADPLVTGDWHGWYGLPGQIASVSCTSDLDELVLTTREKYYPLLQELTYIRPLRMLSPAMFVGGLQSDPYTQNSCHAGWGNITGALDSGDRTVQCVGSLGISGTGPWMYEQTTLKSESEEVQEVSFLRHADHWAGVAADGVERLRLVRYEDHAAVKTALLQGTLDVVVGSGPLEPADIALFQREEHASNFGVYLTEPLQNRIVVLNTYKAPTSDLQVRKLLIHGVNKAAIIQKELAGLDEPVDALFPKAAPYSHIDLTPRWDFDLEKARFINCPLTAMNRTVIIKGDGDGGGLSDGAIWGIAILSVVVAVVMVFVGYMVSREKRGTPLFTPLIDNPMADDHYLGDDKQVMKVQPKVLDEVVSMFEAASKGKNTTGVMATASGPWGCV